MDISIIPKRQTVRNTPEGKIKSARYSGARSYALVRSLFCIVAGGLSNAVRRTSRSLTFTRAKASEVISKIVLPRALGAFTLTAMVVCLLSAAFIGVGLQVYIDGLPVGFVSGRGEFQSIVRGVESKAAAILGYPYTMEVDVDYRLEMYNRRSVINADEIEQYLFNNIPEVTKTYVLKVDGEVLAANSDRDALEDILSGIIDLTLADAGDGAVAEFNRSVDLSYGYTSAINEKPLEEIETKLSSNLIDKTIYVVQPGDLFSDIASRHGMSVEALLELNPDLNPALIVEGDEVVLSEAVPLMSMKLISTEEYDVTVRYETEYIYDSTLWDGDRVVRTSGKDGVLHVVADVEYVDGKETVRTILSEEYISEPVTEVVALGTRNFILPFPGYRSISSRFGGRTFRGSYDYHTGIDFSGAKGAKVIASYDGTVEFSGWKGNYGNCVIINHGGGYKTLYAHNSALKVTVGEKVVQGQTIALVGSTGRSTGNHCHFEVIINGTPVNPWKYLF